MEPRVMKDAAQPSGDAITAAAAAPAGVPPLRRPSACTAGHGSSTVTSSAASHRTPPDDDGHSEDDGDLDDPAFSGVALLGASSTPRGSWLNLSLLPESLGVQQTQQPVAGGGGGGGGGGGCELAAAAGAGGSGNPPAGDPAVPAQLRSRQLSFEEHVSALLVQRGQHADFSAEFDAARDSWSLSWREAADRQPSFRFPRVSEAPPVVDAAAAAAASAAAGGGSSAAQAAVDSLAAALLRAAAPLGEAAAAPTPPSEGDVGACVGGVYEIAPPSEGGGGGRASWATAAAAITATTDAATTTTSTTLRPPPMSRVGSCAELGAGVDDGSAPPSSAHSASVCPSSRSIGGPVTGGAAVWRPGEAVSPVPPQWGAGEIAFAPSPLPPPPPRVRSLVASAPLPHGGAAARPATPGET